MLIANYSKIYKFCEDIQCKVTQNNSRDAANCEYAGYYVDHRMRCEIQFWLKTPWKLFISDIPTTYFIIKIVSCLCDRAPLNFNVQLHKF